jgi:DNA polymerase II small subunit
MEEAKQSKKEIVNFLLEKGILIDAELLEKLESVSGVEELITLLNEKVKSEKLLVVNKDLKELLAKKQVIDINWQDFEKARVLFEKRKNQTLYKKFLDYISTEKEVIKKTSSQESHVKVVFSYREKSKKREIQDFVAFFNARYNVLEKILSSRQELQNLNSINRIIKKKDRESVSLIGMVKDKQYTKNNNIILQLEDQTGTIKVFVSKNKPDLCKQAQDIVLDEVVGVIGVNGDNILFANKILWPDVPLNKELKRSDDEAYAVFLSDLHIGSTQFLPEEFNKFLLWIRGETGNEHQRNIAAKVKYIFLVGDLVDGIGIYPNQEKELEIKDIYLQYEECARLLSKIPEHIPLIICPGNHDAMRIAEPQPELYKDFAKPIWDLPNTIMVSNPSYVNIHSSKDFPGFDVLLYHGYSFDYYVANVDTIRLNGGYDRADLIMKFLLVRRHLAPTHTSTLYLPDTRKDSLVIDRIPDFFVTGHIHKSSVSSYKNITLICGSCWQSKTTFQEKVGHHPEPCRVPIVNLRTRNVKIMKFGD